MTRQAKRPTLDAPQKFSSLSEETRAQIRRYVAEALVKERSLIQIRKGIRKHFQVTLIPIVLRQLAVSKTVDRIVREIRDGDKGSDFTPLNDAEYFEWANDYRNQQVALARIANDPEAEPRIRIAAMKEIRESRSGEKAEDLKKWRAEVELLIRELQHETGMSRAVIIGKLLPDIQWADEELKNRLILELRLEELNSPPTSETPLSLPEPSSD